MNRQSLILLYALAGLLLFSACGQQSSPDNSTEANEGSQKVAQEEPAALRTITYLGTDYEVPAAPQKILFMSAFESMEDAVVLGVEPYASSAIGDDDDPFPGFYGTVMRSTIPLLGTTEETLEYLLDLSPDLIIGTDMETATVHERLSKIAPTIPVSHFGPDWQNNLELLAELTGKQEQARTVIADYEKSREEARQLVASLDQNTEVLAIRVRGQQMMIYPEDVFLNDVLYEQLGFKVPGLIQKTGQQEVLSLEGLSQMNPDYILLQYDLYENGGSMAALDELQNSPVWQGLDAAKNSRAYVNAVDPLVSGGGTANGKIAITRAVLEKFR
ncbi:iron-uptake system-binding protein [Paenibacillaceae bacterium]|nr:iron-uptake system-binding protein [Paenibacillaceae bacterium]